MERLRKNKKSFVSALHIERKVKFYFLLSVSLLLIFISIIKPKVATDIKIGFLDIVSPVIVFISKPFAEASEGINSISNIATLKAENSKLKTENDQLKNWYQTALMLSAENQALQSLLNLKIDPEIKYISARVLLDTQNTFSKTVLIAVGEKHGIKKNQVVLSGDGVIGRVIKVGGNVSRVLLITDLNSRIPVIIADLNKRSVLSGNNSDHLVMKHLELTTNDMLQKKVITTGDGGVFPAGLYVGTITEIKDSDIKVRPFSKLENLKFVRILQEPQERNQNPLQGF